MSTRFGVSAIDLLQMPNDGIRRELVAGELKEMTPAGHEHGSVTMNFSGPLHTFVKANNLGVVYAAETGFLLSSDPDTVRAPDIAFVNRERVRVLQKGGYFPGPPDLAVEVISPGDTYAEGEDKVHSWLDAGCQLVVVVNSRNRTVKVYRSTSAVTILTIDDSFQAQELLPGFDLPVRQIFE
jgi:Uma2 family endonuclease